MKIKNAAVKQRGTFKRRQRKEDDSDPRLPEDLPRCDGCGYWTHECRCPNSMKDLWLKLGLLIKVGDAAKHLDDHHTQTRVSSKTTVVEFDSHLWCEFINAVRKYRGGP